MHRLWKVVRLFWAMVTRSPYVNVKARKRSDDEALRYRAHRIQIGCAMLCDILGADVRTEGPVPAESGMLAVANHFGVLDPLIIASVLPCAPVGKAEMRNWPFIGWVSLAHGLIPVDRERRSTISRFAEQVGRRLSAGVNVLVFPEGTTSSDLEVRPFKTGAFEAVAGSDAAVLPLYLAVDSIDGQPAEGLFRRRVVWADDTQTFGEHAADVVSIRQLSYSVIFGDPIPAKHRDRKELAQLARTAVEDLRKRRETIDA